MFTPARLGLSLAALVVIAFGHSEKAHALSAGCEALNSAGFIGPGNSIGPEDFNAGEVIVVSISVAAGMNVNVLGSFPTPSPLLSVTIGNVGSNTFVVPVTGPGTIQNTSVGDSVDVSCAAGATEAQQQSSANAAAISMSSGSGGLVSGRTNGLTGGSPAGRTGGADVQTGLIDLSAGRQGMAAGYNESPWGVWANFTWSGIEDTTAVAGQDGNVVIGVAGADYLVSEGFIVGGAISVGGASFDSTVAQFDTDEMGIGITPYLAYQISDLITLDAMIGYNFAVGESTRAETITGHYGIHRYFVGSNLSYFQAWDRFSVLASGGVIWGQSFENAYGESDGTQVSSRQVDLGSFSILAQPAYLIDLDARAGFFLEPYVLAEYSYDFVISKIAGHNNDRDAFRLGLGFNIFDGQHISGNLEASSTIGREDQRTVSVLGTLRYSF